MDSSGTSPTLDGTKRFFVKCDGCSFEQRVTGRDEATQIGTAHRHETGHDLVAVEVPPSF